MSNESLSTSPQLRQSLELFLRHYPRPTDTDVVAWLQRMTFYPHEARAFVSLVAEATGREPADIPAKYVQLPPAELEAWAVEPEVIEPAELAKRIREGRGDDFEGKRWYWMILEIVAQTKNWWGVSPSWGERTERRVLDHRTVCIDWYWDTEHVQLTAGKNLDIEDGEVYEFEPQILVNKSELEPYEVPDMCAALSDAASLAEREERTVRRPINLAAEPRTEGIGGGL